MANEKPDFRMVTPKARLSYPHLYVAAPGMNEGDKAKYSCELIFEKGTDITALRKMATDCARNKWGANIPKNLKTPFRKGDEDREGRDGYEDSIFIGARSVDKPGVVVGPNREPLLDPTEVYGGCYVRCHVTAFAYEVKNKSGAIVNTGIGFALNHVWKIADGEPFGNRTTAESAFEDCDSESGLDTVDSLL